VAGMEEHRRVLVADEIAPEGLEILRSGAEVAVKPGLSEAELVAEIGPFQAIVVRSRTKVTARVIEAGRALEVIARAGAGVDNVDVEAATSHGILVINSPAANSLATAEHTIAMMLALARHIPQAHVHVKAGQWDRKRFTGVELAGKTLGIVGLGRVGRLVAERARALGMTVLACDPFLDSGRITLSGAMPVNLEGLLSQSDFVTVHCPLIEETRCLIGKKELALAKEGVRIVNCARGGIVDEEALYEALVEDRVAGAALDVFEEEPPLHCPLLSLENVIVTPHLGASTREAQDRVGLTIAEDLLRVFRGEEPDSPVNQPQRV